MTAEASGTQQFEDVFFCRRSVVLSLVILSVDRTTVRMEDSIASEIIYNIGMKSTIAALK